jgi:hypothetical protein
VAGGRAITDEQVNQIFDPELYQKVLEEAKQEQEKRAIARQQQQQMGVNSEAALKLS